MKQKLIEEHYLLNYNTLVKKITRRVPNQSVALAEEVVQEAYARALKYQATFEPKINTFEKWFNGILRNATNDCKSAEGGNNKEYDENVEDIRTNKDEHKHLRHILMELYRVQKSSQRDYLLLSMFYVHGFTSKDIAIHMGMTHTNVRQIIFKFRNKLNETSDGANKSPI